VVHRETVQVSQKHVMVHFLATAVLSPSLL